MKTGEVLQPMYSKSEVEDGSSLQIFVMTLDYYSNPYTVLIVSESEEAALELLSEAKSNGFRVPGSGRQGYYGRLDSEKLLVLDPTMAGIYAFEAPGNRDLIR